MSSRAAAAAAAAALLIGLASCRGREPGKADPGGEALVVFSSHPADLARPIVAEYRERGGPPVRLVLAGTGELLRRLRGGEGCDVFWGGGAESLAANADLFEPYASAEDAAIPDEYKAPDRSWTGFTVLPMVIGYNARLVPRARAPRSWADLLDPFFAGSIAYADPAVSGSSYTLLRTIGTALGGRGGPGREAAERAFAAALDGKLLASSASVFPSVASGEYLVGLFHDQAALELIAAGSDLAFSYPAEGTSAVPDGVALARRSPHAAQARAFIDFVLGPDVAEYMAARYLRRSTRRDAPPPAGQPPLSRIRLVPYDIQAAAADKEAAIARFKAAFAAR